MRLLARPAHQLAVVLGGVGVVEPSVVAPWIGLISTERLVVAVVDGAAFVTDECAH